MGQALRTEGRTDGQTLGEQKVDLRVGVAEAAEEGVGEGVVAGKAWVKADGGEDIAVPCMGEENVSEFRDLLCDAWVMRLHGIEAEQEHRGFGDDFFAKEGREANGLGADLSFPAICVDSDFDHPARHLEHAKDSPDQVRPIPTGCECE